MRLLFGHILLIGGSPCEEKHDISIPKIKCQNNVHAESLEVMLSYLMTFLQHCQP